MAQMSPVPSDASDDGKKKKASRSAAKNKKDKKEESEVEDSEPQSDAENPGESEDEEEEYEIEAILDAKKGQFPKNKLGYFVKWKGYGDEHNSWITEEDAGNAKELIDEFWERKRAGKKSAPDGASAKRASRKSVTVDDDSEAGESASAPPKKRGRKPNAEKATSSAKAKAKSKDEEEEDERPAKKARRLSKKSAPEQEPLPDDEDLGNMSQHMQAPTWDQLIKHIDTVERVDDGTLYVYFTLTSGKRVRESSTICNEKFPQMLLRFYENNLRWKVAETN